MRAAGTQWLPKEQKEDATNYQRRVDRTFLHPAFRDTIDRLVAKPFAKDVVVEKLPDRFKEFPRNVDGESSNLTSFARETMRDLMSYGRAHVLVDFPNLPPAPNLKEDLERSPYFVRISPMDLFFWESEIRGKDRVLTEIRFYETQVKRSGSMSQTPVMRVRVYKTATWEIWERNEEKENEWVKVSEGTHTFGAVPLVTIYANRPAFMMADPPLDELAWMNLAHWQSSSDQRNILRVARCGILFARGFNDNELQTLTIAPTSLLKSTSPNAEVRWIEHTGSAIKAGADDLAHLEEVMEILGLQPLISRSSKTLATVKEIDENRADTDVQAWIRSMESGLEMAFEYLGRWVSLEVAADVELNSDFGISTRAQQDLQTLIQMRRQGDLSRETFLKEVKKRGVLSETVVVEEELGAIEAEGPDLASITEPKSSEPDDSSGGGTGAPEE